MARQVEREISTAIVHALNARGHFAFKHFSGSFSMPGISDVLGCRNDGIAIFLEVKRPGKEIKGLSGVQGAFLRRIIGKTDGRAIVAVVTSVAGAIAAVECDPAVSVESPSGRFDRIWAKGFSLDTPSDHAL